MKFLSKAISLAKKARGKTSPNPLVGAVIVKNNKIISHGYHKKAGQDHAEIAALRKIDFNAKGTTLYLTLEPCTFTGKTPPCVDQIIKSGVKRVVISSLDPNPKVHGKGASKLKKAGIKTEIGLLEKESLKMNEVFNKFIKTGRPYITLKWAQTLDGKIGLRKEGITWISSKETLIESHSKRKYLDAILCGVNTIINDNPSLTSSFQGKKYGKDPIKIVLDSKLSLVNYIDRKILNSGNDVIIFTSKKSSKKAEKLLLENKRIKIKRVSKLSGGLSLEEILRVLGKLEITNVLVEGGANILTSFLKAKTFDKIICYLSLQFFGDKGIPLIAGKIIESDLKIEQIKKLGTDLRLTLTSN
ncbi:MAG: bifunctional diaminohydroxyphosphoribosylaminopyrimidine deaminase/5-amino-6-(5-phosphoribosylamino)uracil reductase RibD [Pseudomonadota bacterium]